MRLNITRTRAIEVDSYAAASAAIVAHWDARGARAMYRDPVAGIIEVDGARVAHVSYNGRVWATADRMSVGAAEISTVAS